MKFNIEKKQSLILSILFIAVFIFIIDSFAQIYFLYYKLWWLDILMHTTGGLFIGLFSLYIYYFSGILEPKHKEKYFILSLSLLSSVFIGVLWEFFEFLLEVFIEAKFGIDELLKLTLSDTISDLFFDLSGGIFAFIIFFLLWEREI